MASWNKDNNASNSNDENDNDNDDDDDDDDNDNDDDDPIFYRKHSTHSINPSI